MWCIWHLQAVWGHVDIGKEWATCYRYNWGSEHASSLLWAANLPVGFWVCVVCTSIYWLNRSPHCALETPLLGWKPNLGHLRVFGGHAVAHVSDELRNKTMWISTHWIFVATVRQRTCSNSRRKLGQELRIEQEQLEHERITEDAHLVQLPKMHLLSHFTEQSPEYGPLPQFCINIYGASHKVLKMHTVAPIKHSEWLISWF